MATIAVTTAPSGSEKALPLRLVSLESKAPMLGVLFQIGRKAACRPVLAATKSHGTLPLSVLQSAAEHYRGTKM